MYWSKILKCAVFRVYCYFSVVMERSYLISYKLKTNSLHMQHILNLSVYSRIVCCSFSSEWPNSDNQADLCNKVDQLKKNAQYDPFKTPTNSYTILSDPAVFKAVFKSKTLHAQIFSTKKSTNCWAVSNTSDIK